MYQIKYTYPNFDYPDEYELYLDNYEFVSINYAPIPYVPIIKEVEVLVDD
jgi:hypothetical protein